MKDIIALAKELADEMELLKSLEKSVNKKKELLKKELTDGTHILDNVVISLSTQMRESINKDELIKDFGIATISKYTKISEYRIISVKSAKAA